MHRLSIVIPCPVFNQSAEDTLVSVLQHRPTNTEVIVVIAGKYDDPYELDGEVLFVEAEEGAGITQLVNHGFAAASADVVHVIVPGVQALDQWTDSVLAHFTDPQVGSVSPALVAKGTDRRALSLGVGYWACGNRRVIGKGAKLNNGRNSQAAILGPSLEAGFYRRDVITALGGFDEGMDLHGADVEVALALRQLGYQSIVEPASTLKRGQIDFCSSSFRRARQAERLFRRYCTPGAALILVHALLAAFDLLKTFPRPQLLSKGCGRIAAWFEFGIQERQQERVHQAQAYLARIAVSHSPASLRGDFSKSRGKQASAAGHHARRRAA